MKIAIDIQTTLGQKTGFGFYVKNLVAHLKKINSHHQYALFAPNTQKDFSAPRRWWWDQVEVPLKARQAGVDILHQPAFSAPILYRGKVVVTVHDLIAIVYGQDIPFFARQYFGRWMPFSYRAADHIIAISEHTKQDLVKLLNINDRAITVIPLACGEQFKPPKDSRRFGDALAKYRVKMPYILHVGTLNPRKNLHFLIRVFAEVVKRLPNYNLVITGKFGWYYEGLFKLVKEFGLTDKVIFTGYVLDEDTPELYGGAAIFAFPSVYEGFGLPPLEAMACGAPVVASGVSSIPEVVGQAGILLEPNDLSGWTQAICKVLRDARLARKMRQAGFAQSRKFSWDKTAAATIKVYEKIHSSDIEL